MDRLIGTLVYGDTLELRTERIEIRHLYVDDRLEMMKLLSNAEVMEYSFSEPMNQSEAKNYLLSAIDSNKKYGYGIFALSLIEGNSFIGYCGYTYYAELDGTVEIELGYRLHPQYWGQGLATEAASKVLTYGQDQLGLGRIISLIRKGNKPSIKVATKIGAQFEKEISINGQAALIYVYCKND